MRKTAIRSRLETAVLVMLLLTSAGIVLARSRHQPESRLARSLTFGVLTPSTAPPFRINIDGVRADGTSAAPLLPESATVEPPVVQVPATVQNLHRVNQN